MFALLALLAALLPAVCVEAVAVSATSSAAAIAASSLRSSAALRAKKGIFQFYDGIVETGRCGCECCIVGTRRPTEPGGEGLPKCTVPPPLQQRCSDTCSSIGDPVLFNVRGIVLTERYCLYRCVPGGDKLPSEKAKLRQKPTASFLGGFAVDTMCVEAPVDEAKYAISADGNGRDAELEPAGAQEPEKWASEGIGDAGLGLKSPEGAAA
mmetsp:Transcript_107512/g.272829  ORF Transcript_107512/g.272829 Transcript_107512/m.272829 type:complete len:210 (+) Transcript_107512:99-728(+)